MPIWLRKLFVVLITVLTLGMVSPPSFLLITDDNKSPSKADTADHEEERESDSIQIESVERATQWSGIVSRLPVDEIVPTFVSYSINQAEQQTVEKFGTKITEKVGDQFNSEILPKIEEVIHKLSESLDEESIKYLGITDKPAAGLGEKIFHIYDMRTGKDVFRYHVRREHPPQEGYWFSFHYHMADDNFSSHNELGKIYWDKNTPPNWMS